MTKMTKKTKKSAKPVLEKKPQKRSYIPVVGVGASAGGLDAFKNFFESMPSDTGMAFVLIQHLDPTHESLMVDLLSRHTKMRVVQVEDRMQVEPNHVYMIPPAHDLAINNGELYLTEPAQRRGMRMPIDFFFRSVAEDQRERAICIILSGTGSDGTLGLKAIKSYGGMVMAQTPKTAQYDGMPVSAISTGAVDYVLPVEEMPEAISKYVQHSYVRGRFGTDQYDETGGQDLNNVLAIMNAQLGHNFHHYKKNTLMRRIQRRMGLKQFEKMNDYVVYLRSNQDETKELFKDMLIGVTGFFRDAESWQILQEKVVSDFVTNKDHDVPLRVWVPGCSTGEEAYTIAIMFMETFKKAGKAADFQIFATDIDTTALELARCGRYPESIASDISSSLLNEYFIKEDDFYLVSSSLRDKIVFSEQNLISDPPFSKLNIISCRNLLIYLESDVQSRVIELFHFSLVPSGYLQLGNSETIGKQEDIFQVISKKWRLFKRLDSAQRRRPHFPILPSNRQGRFTIPDINLSSKPIRIAELVSKALLDKYAPSAVLTNRKHEVLYHYGNTVDYLSYPTGESTNDLYLLARKGLVTRLRGAMHKAIKDDHDIIVSGARVLREDKYVGIKFSVSPLKQFEGGEGLLLVCFEENPQDSGKKAGTSLSADEEPIVQQLEYELSATKEDLQNTIEELETSNEELKASNEEVMSMNEELQSSNEELETSKEELQSLNEELNTVNSELQDKVLVLETTNNDLSNLINSTSVASIFLDTRFKIKFFTPAAKNLFNLITTDIGRSLEDISPRFTDVELHSEIEDVLNTLRSREKEVSNDKGMWFNRRILPYRTSDSRIEGIVLTFEDITKLKQSQLEIANQVTEQTEILRQKNELLLQIFSSIHVMTAHLDKDYNIVQANDLFAEAYGLKTSDVCGKNYFALSSESTEDKEILARALETGEAHFILAKGCVADSCRADSRLCDWVIKPLKNDIGQVTGLLLSIVDVTERELEIRRLQEK